MSFSSSLFNRVMFANNSRGSLCNNIQGNRNTLSHNTEFSNYFLQTRFATKKAQGSTKNGRDSNPKFLGAKKNDGEHVISGNIILRQRGTRWYPGENVGMGKDHTLFAKQNGIVKFVKGSLIGNRKTPSRIHVMRDPIVLTEVPPEWGVPNELIGKLEPKQTSKINI